MKCQKLLHAQALECVSVCLISLAKESYNLEYVAFLGLGDPQRWQSGETKNKERHSKFLPLSLDAVSKFKAVHDDVVLTAEMCMHLVHRLLHGDELLRILVGDVDPQPFEGFPDLALAETT